MAAAALAGRASTLAPSAAIAARHSVPVSVAFAVVTNGVARGDASDDGAGGAVHHAATEQCSAPGTRGRQEQLLGQHAGSGFSFPAADADASSAPRIRRGRRPAAARAPRPPPRAAAAAGRNAATPWGPPRTPRTRRSCRRRDRRPARRGAAVSPDATQAPRRALPRRGRAARARAKKVAAAANARAAGVSAREKRGERVT